MRKANHISFAEGSPALAARGSLRAVAAPKRPARRVRSGDAISTSDTPAGSYLSRLRESGRRSVRSRLDRAAGIITPGANADTFPWGTLTFSDVDRVRSRLQFDGASSAYVNLTLTALRQTAAVARRQGLIGADELDSIRGVRAPRSESFPRGRMLQREEKEALFCLCSADSSARGRRDAALLALLAGAGLRREEAATLRLADCDSSTRRLRVRGKGGTAAVVPLKEETAQALSDWIRVRGRASGFLLAPVSRSGRVLRPEEGMTAQAIYLVVRRLADAADLSYCTPHDLRRTFISELWDSGADASTVQKSARHRNISTSQRYDRRGETAVAEAVEQVYVPYRKPPTHPRPRRAQRSKKKRGRRNGVSDLKAGRKSQLTLLARAHGAQVMPEMTKDQLVEAIREKTT
jgi:integrase/recombinase XerD